LYEKLGKEMQKAMKEALSMKKEVGDQRKKQQAGATATAGDEEDVPEWVRSANRDPQGVEWARLAELWNVLT